MMKSLDCLSIRLLQCMHLCLYAMRPLMCCLRSFVRSGRLFELRYTYINIRKDFTGALKCLELGGGVGQQNAFLHSCTSPTFL